MANLIIVANVQARADKIELVKAELQKLIEITRAEAGCIQYDLHQDNDPAYVPHLKARTAGSNSHHFLIEGRDDLT
jgi:quinol monooxygenase YgiN